MQLRVALVFWITFGLFGCAVDELDLEGRACPCVTGWVCVSDVCVRDRSMDGGPTTGTDGGPMTDTDGGPTTGIDGGPMMGTDSGPVMGTDGGPTMGTDGGRTRDTTCDGPLGARLFCDGFEDSDFGAWQGVEADGAGIVERVTDPVYRGRYAMRSYATSTYAVVYKELFSPTQTDEWFRAYYYFPSSTGFPVEVQAVSDADGSYSMVVGAFPPNENIHTHGWAGDRAQTTSAHITPDRWTCIEVHIHTSATTGAIELYFDDTRVAQVTGIDTTSPRGMTTIGAGIIWKETSDPPRTVYVDEVVADTARIGCD